MLVTLAVVSQHCHFHLWQCGKHSCASVLLNNIYFFGSSGLLYTFLAAVAHICSLSVSHLKAEAVTDVWCTCVATPPAASDTCPLSTRDWTNNPIRRPPTLSLRFICALWNMSDNRKTLEQDRKKKWCYRDWGSRPEPEASWRAPPLPAVEPPNTKLCNKP